MGIAETPRENLVSDSVESANELTDDLALEVIDFVRTNVFRNGEGEFFARNLEKFDGVHGTPDKMRGNLWSFQMASIIFLLRERRKIKGTLFSSLALNDPHGPNPFVPNVCQSIYYMGLDEKIRGRGFSRDLLNMADYHGNYLSRVFRGPITQVLNVQTVEGFEKVHDMFMRRGFEDAGFDFTDEQILLMKRSIVDPAVVSSRADL